MTVPIERARAIHWGRDFLDRLPQDASLPEPVIAEAMRIAWAYPTLEEFDDRLRSGAPGLPTKWVQAFLDAFRLFERLSMSGLGSAKTRDLLMYTLRHFPDEMSIRILAGAVALDAWLLPVSYNSR